jgi:group I intron endonuclease
MLLLNLITLVRTIPLASQHPSTILILRFAFLIFLSGTLFSEILRGLFQTTLLSQSLLIFLGSLLLIEEPNFLLSFIPSFQDGLLATAVIVYSNAEADKARIIADNKGKTGIYLWLNNINRKSYIGSAVNLSRRLNDYYSPSTLKRMDNIISKAIIRYSHSAFSLTILEIIDISSLSVKETRKLILSREQYYIDTLMPEYNILKIAGSSLGLTLSEETKTKMSEAKIGEKNSFYNKTHSEESLTKISIARRGRFHSSETKALISKAMRGENNPMFGRTGENSPNFGKSFTIETKTKISIAKGGGSIFVYSSNKKTLLNTFYSARKAAEHFNTSHSIILKHARNGTLYKEQWIFSMKLLEA